MTGLEPPNRERPSIVARSWLPAVIVLGGVFLVATIAKAVGWWW